MLLSIVTAYAIAISAGFTVHGQHNGNDSIFYGFILTEEFEPVPNTHIINLRKGTGTVSDKIGFFKIHAVNGDYLLIKNIIFGDTIIKVMDYKAGMILKVSEKKYSIDELKVFRWGTSYDDFKKAFLTLEPEEDLTEKLGFKHPDPDFLPFYMDEDKVKKLVNLRKSPISYIYYNLSRRERIIRKAIKYERTRKNRDYVNNILTRENIASITGYNGQELEDFLLYLNDNFRCDHTCKEFEIINEIYYWWNKYKGDGG